MNPVGTAVRRQLMGLGLVVVLLALVALAIAKYQGAFERAATVTLQADRVGNQLQERSDVKIRGVIVGKVEKVSSNGRVASVELSVKPEYLSSIPRNVQARLLPKTLFGEKYVALVNPPQPSPEHLAPGDTISQDRTKAAMELDRVLDGLLPLLQAVKPQQLATTLGALSQSLEGRGEKLGDTLVRLHQLFSQLNTALPDLKADITQLADFSDNLNNAAPDLLNALADFTTTTRTVVEERENLLALYSSVTAVSGDLEQFLRQNRDNIIWLAASSRPTLESLARYSPEFPCLLNQIAQQVPLLNRAFGVDTPHPGLHITLEITNHRGKYIPNQDEPEYLDDRGPRCYTPVVPEPQYSPEGPIRDGSVPPPAGMSAIGGGILPIADMGLANSPGEQRFVAQMLAAQGGGSPSEIPNWSTLLVGPLYRGAEVRMT